ncbi:MAG: metal-dependent hydrolase [Gammaproteobacteria bacterium]|nr:metal-dependent hydrolase [Gammaproteobacteria bacterium]
MDPISQGALGAVVPQTLLRHENLGRLTLCAALAGMAPDLDVFITSETDPLMFLVYHRQFTHSLVFIPIGALIVAGGLYPFMRKAIEFKYLYLACLLGYATHGLLDACTSYGTQLFWPFTDYRVAWNVVSVLDPTFTIPLLVAVIAALLWRRRWIAGLGLLWAVVYLSFGTLQSYTAYQAGATLAELRNHEAQHLTVKPSIANAFVFKVIYEFENTYYIDAVRVGLDRQATICGLGSKIAKLDIQHDLPWLAPGQQREDVARFNWFSQGYVAMDPAVPNRIFDVRYSVIPNELTPLWVIDLDPNASSSAHVTFSNVQSVDEGQMDRMFAMLRGSSCRPLHAEVSA